MSVMSMQDITIYERYVCIGNARCSTCPCRVQDSKRIMGSRSPIKQDVSENNGMIVKTTVREFIVQRSIQARYNMRDDKFKMVAPR